MSLWRLPPVVIIHLKRFQFTQHTRRKLRDLVIFPIEGLDLSRIKCADSKNKVPSSNGTTQTTTTTTTDTEHGKNNDDLLYDLYGVVHHQGALSGGHYVASLKSELDGQWRLFNDAQIYEIHSRDVVDTSAYILFYIRRDAKEAKLGDFWEARTEGQGLTEEEMNKLIKGRSERCVIS
jgi:ubiquitin C-terminal hydrolase